MGEFNIENPHEIYSGDFEDMLIKGDFEVFSKSQIDNYLNTIGSILEKSETTDLEDSEKSQIEIAKSEVASFQKFSVVDDEFNKSLRFIRPRQIEWDTAPNGDILKGQSGTYKETRLNHSLNRVGEKWTSHAYDEISKGE